MNLFDGILKIARGRRPQALFHCSVCKDLAARVEILPPGDAQSLSNKHTLAITGFIGNERIALSPVSAEALRPVLQRADPAGLYAIEKLWAPFYCPDCSSVYCIRHWTVIPVWDGDFYDCSYGYCPQGHKRLIED